MRAWRLAAVLPALLALACAVRPAAPGGAGGAAAPGPAPRLELLGEAELAPGSRHAGTVVGGLSALAWDARRDVYYALSDDPSSRAAARFYTLAIDLAGGALAPQGVRVLAVTPLLDEAGRSFAELTLDPEGMALTERDTLVISSEGQAVRGVAPFLREFGLDGRSRRELRLPRRAGLDDGAGHGVRHNLAYESLTLARPEAALYTATESALLQDGPVADVGRPSAVRLLRMTWPRGRLAASYLLCIDPVPRAPLPEDAFRVSGLVELLSLAPGELLALERSFAAGVGNGARLYRLTLAGATDVRRRRALPPTACGAEAGPPPGASHEHRVRAVRKELLLDLADLGPRLRGPLDNLEGMTWGPVLGDDRRTLVLVSDDNFNERQRTQFLAFSVVG